MKKAFILTIRFCRVILLFSFLSLFCLANWVWWRSYNLNDEIAIETEIVEPKENAAFTGIYVGTMRGAVYCFKARRDESNASIEGVFVNSRTIEHRKDQPVREFAFIDVCPNGVPPIHPEWQHLGFAYTGGTTLADEAKFSSFVVPLWAISVVLLIPLVLQVLILWKRRRRSRQRGFEILSKD